MSAAVALVAARSSDARFVWEVNNHPTTRAQSIRTGAIVWEDHLEWFARVAAASPTRLWIAVADGVPIGVLRLDYEGTTATVSLAVHPERRGAGHGTAMIRAGCDAARGAGATRVLAFVRPDNARSRRAFERAGFANTGSPTIEGVQLLEMSVPLHARGDDMSEKSRFKTAQEEFWAGDFGDQYSDRNRGAPLLAGKLAMFRDALRRTVHVESVLELGANIGLNLDALHMLVPNAKLCGIEINERAHAEMAKRPYIDARLGSLLDAPIEPASWDLVFTAGVLIHIGPDALPRAYEQMVQASRRYVLVAEYYNPSPVEISYRGHSERLFKRDFAGELLERDPNLRLIDYGFQYRRDPNFPADDITWFLLEKR